MTEMTMTSAKIPSWDVADRMRKALRHTDISVAQMADWLGVDRGTVSTWINGRITPSVQTLRLWALRTGVDYEWLRTGQTADDGSLMRHTTDVDGPLSVPVKRPFRRSGGGMSRPPGRSDSRSPSRPADHRHPLARKSTRPLSGAA